MGTESDRGLLCQQFAHYDLMKRDDGQSVQQILLNHRDFRRLASEAELLALCPELAQSE